MQKAQVTPIHAFWIFVLLVALLIIQWTPKNVGLGVYWDPQCKNPAFSLDFGQLEPASSKSFNLYLRNEGNSDLILNMTSGNWNPANAADYMTLTWNREGQQISPNEVLGCVIALSVSEDIQGVSSFSLDIIISGTD